MPINPADDFRIFEGTEHMFFGLPDPFAVIRQETEAGLKRQVADTELISIVAHGEPKFIATGTKSEDGTMHATDFGFSFRATMTVAFNQGAQRGSPRGGAHVPLRWIEPSRGRPPQDA